jgi:4-hydroxybenzoate polyprenyltransferase
LANFNAFTNVEHFIFLSNIINKYLIEDRMTNIIQLLRPHQWLKNLFIFLPLFFDRHIMEWSYLLPAILAFWAFSFAASSIYCFNDIYDVEADRLHPKKCMRPIASGAISMASGYAIMVVTFLMSLAFIILSQNLIGGGKISLLIIIVYYVMNIAYCMRLKQIAVVDVFIIAIGFVSRVLMGGFATGIYISHWIVLMTFLLALFLAFAKRRDDVVMYENTGIKARKNVDRYNLDFMNQVIGVIASITMVCYIMYTVSEEVVHRLNCPYVYVTAIFVLAGIIRYLQVTIVDVKSGSPTKVLMKDRFLQLCILGWLAVFAIILYL